MLLIFFFIGLVNCQDYVTKETKTFTSPNFPEPSNSSLTHENHTIETHKDHKILIVAEIWETKGNNSGCKEAYLGIKGFADFCGNSSMNFAFLPTNVAHFQLRVVAGSRVKLVANSLKWTMDNQISPRRKVFHNFEEDIFKKKEVYNPAYLLQEKGDIQYTFFGGKGYMFGYCLDRFQRNITSDFPCDKLTLRFGTETFCGGKPRLKVTFWTKSPAVNFQMNFTQGGAPILRCVIKTAPTKSFLEQL